MPAPMIAPTPSAVSDTGPSTRRRRFSLDQLLFEELHALHGQQLLGELHERSFGTRVRALARRAYSLILDGRLGSGGHRAAATQSRCSLLGTRAWMRP